MNSKKKQSKGKRKLIRLLYVVFKLQRRKKCNEMKGLTPSISL